MPPTKETVFCFICCCSLGQARLAPTKSYGKSLRDAIRTICKYLLIPHKDVNDIISSSSESESFFCPTCLVVAEDIIEIERKVEVLKLHIRNKVDILGRTILGTPEEVLSKRVKRSGKGSERVLKFNRPVINNYLQGLLPKPSIHLKQIQISVSTNADVGGTGAEIPISVEHDVPTLLELEKMEVELEIDKKLSSKENSKSEDKVENDVPILPNHVLRLDDHDDDLGSNNHLSTSVMMAPENFSYPVDKSWTRIKIKDNRVISLTHSSTAVVEEQGQFHQVGLNNSRSTRRGKRKIQPEEVSIIHDSNEVTALESGTTIKPETVKVEMIEPDSNDVNQYYNAEDNGDISCRFCGHRFTEESCSEGYTMESVLMYHIRVAHLEFEDAIPFSQELCNSEVTDSQDMERSLDPLETVANPRNEERYWYDLTNDSNEESSNPIPHVDNHPEYYDPTEQNGDNTTTARIQQLHCSDCRYIVMIKYIDGMEPNKCQDNAQKVLDLHIKNIHRRGDPTLSINKMNTRVNCHKCDFYAQVNYISGMDPNHCRNDALKVLQSHILNTHSERQQEIIINNTSPTITRKYYFRIDINGDKVNCSKCDYFTIVKHEDGLPDWKSRKNATAEITSHFSTAHGHELPSAANVHVTITMGDEYGTEWLSCSKCDYIVKIKKKNVADVNASIESALKVLDVHFNIKHGPPSLIAL